MKLKKLLENIEATVLSQKDNIDSIEIKGGYVSDLLSDVLGNAKKGDVWMTIMKHLNVIAVASHTEVSAIIFAKNIVPEKTIIEKAEENGICLISSSLSTFELAGILFALLNSN